MDLYATGCYRQHMQQAVGSAEGARANRVSWGLRGREVHVCQVRLKFARCGQSKVEGVMISLAGY